MWRIYSNPDRYNKKVVEFNKLLKDWTVRNEGSQVSFHHHHAFWNSLDFGVHIRCTSTNTQHMHKYLQSVKRAILRATKRIVGDAVEATGGTGVPSKKDPTA
jgi:hypothetical protein